MVQLHARLHGRPSQRAVLSLALVRASHTPHAHESWCLAAWQACLPAPSSQQRAKLFDHAVRRRAGQAPSPALPQHTLAPSCACTVIRGKGLQAGAGWLTSAQCGMDLCLLAEGAGEGPRQCELGLLPPARRSHCGMWCSVTVACGA